MESQEARSTKHLLLHLARRALHDKAPLIRHQPSHDLSGQPLEQEVPDLKGPLPVSKLRLIHLQAITMALAAVAFGASTEPPLSNRRVQCLAPSPVAGPHAA